MPTPAAEQVTNDPTQGTKPANADNIFAASRQPATSTEEPTVFMTRSEVEVILRREKKKGPISLIFLVLKRPYAVKVAAKPYSVGYVTPQF